MVDLFFVRLAPSCRRQPASSRTPQAVARPPTDGSSGPFRNIHRPAHRRNRVGTERARFEPKTCMASTTRTGIPETLTFHRHRRRDMCG